MLTHQLQRLFSAGALPDPLPADPMPLFKRWFDDAHHAPRTPNPNAMILATATVDGAPSARTVLCKSIDMESPAVIFFTNYEGRKGRELRANPRCAGVFHWDHDQRQARVEGVATVLPAGDSDAYFASRPLLSRLGAWASLQSQPMVRSSDLLTRLAEVAERFAISPADVIAGNNDIDVPRPPHWGGFRIELARLELWAGRSGRLHDRAEWVRTGGAWKAQYLFP
ncbi:MAG: pyridoxamine 5'-phosphate oxidase [Phycisphaerales bacterium]